MEQNRIFLLGLEDLRVEAVLDGGFWNTYSHVADLHCHSYFELMLCPRTPFLIHLRDGATIPMETGSLCLIPPRCYHRLSGEGASQKLAIRLFCTRSLRPGTVYNAFQAVTENAASPVYLGKQPHIMTLVHTVAQELQHRSFAAESCVEGLLMQLLVHILRLLCDPRGTELPVALPEGIAARRLTIEDYLNSRYAQPLTEDSLAEHMHLSKRQLSRILQQLYGMSFRQLLIDIRLNRATQLLCTTDMTPEDIACQVGYASLSGFYDAFRKRYGMSAGSYRRQFQK